QKQRQQRENRNQPGLEPSLGGCCIRQIRHGCDRDRLVLVHIVQSTAHRRRNALRFCGGAYHEAHVAQKKWPRDLLIRLINRGLWLVGQSLLSHIVNHFDNRQPVFWFGIVFHSDSHPDGILTGPECSCHRLADDRDTWGTTVVLLSEAPPVQQSDPHDTKVVMTDSGFRH